MGLKLFADHCVPMSIINSLRDSGFEVFVLFEHLPADATDRQVIEKSSDLGAILLSLNGDFSDIVSYPPANYNGIICIQLKNHPETIPALLSRLIDYCKSHQDNEHYSGKLLIVESHRIRISQPIN